MTLISRPRSRPKFIRNASDRPNSAAIAADQSAAIRVLHLTLHRKWFDAIATGRKTHEFRRNTEFWRRRLLNADLSPRIYDEVHFRNGYHPALPFMRVEWKGLFLRSDLFITKLGERLEIQNWEGPKVS